MRRETVHLVRQAVSEGRRAYVLVINRSEGKIVELAIRIERTTCGLRISDSPTSHNLTPQETTTQDTQEMCAGGAGLSCPGSSVVANADDEKQKMMDRRFLH